MTEQERERLFDDAKAFLDSEDSDYCGQCNSYAQPGEDVVSHLEDCPLFIVGGLLAEARRLRGQLKEARDAAVFMYGVVALAICAVGASVFIPAPLKARFLQTGETMKGWVDDAP